MVYLVLIGVLVFLVRGVVLGIKEGRERKIESLRHEEQLKLQAEREANILAGNILEQDMSIDERAMYWASKERNDKLLELMYLEAQETPGFFIVRERIKEWIERDLVAKERPIDRLAIYEKYPQKLIPPKLWGEWGKQEEKSGRFELAYLLYKRGMRTSGYEFWEYRRECRDGYYRMLKTQKKQERKSYEDQIKEYLKAINAILSFESVKSGKDFEVYISTCIESLGCKCDLTSDSGDYGADLVVSCNDNVKIVVQCKFYSHPVGYHAVQEINAARDIYYADFACVISNSCFTPQAEKGASRLCVTLLHYSEIQEYFNQLKRICSEPTIDKSKYKIMLPYARERNEIRKKRMQKRLTRYDIKRMIANGTLVSKEEIQLAYAELRHQDQGRLM